MGYQNVIGIRIKSKEDYDNLMNNHSTTGFFGINFKGLFEGYPEDDQYPCLIEYYIGQRDPVGFEYDSQLRKIIENGYLVQLYRQEEG